MLVVMQSHATEEQVREVCARIESLGLKAHPIPADESSWGTFNQLFERNQAVLREILEDRDKREVLGVTARHRLLIVAGMAVGMAND